MFGGLHRRAGAAGDDARTNPGRLGGLRHAAASVADHGTAAEPAPARQCGGAVGATMQVHGSAAIQMRDGFRSAHRIFTEGRNGHEKGDGCREPRGAPRVAGDPIESAGYFSVVAWVAGISGAMTVRNLSAGTVIPPSSTTQISLSVAW